MTAIDALLARARLHPNPDVPGDTVPYEDCAYPGLDYDTALPSPHEPAADDKAAHRLRTLCQTVVTVLCPEDLKFLTDQLPEPEGAWLLGCALNVGGVEQGARFWWQYAAGAGHTTAAYCLSLHHDARGETHAASFWYDQTGLDEYDYDIIPVAGLLPPYNDCRFDASVPTVLRILSSLNTPDRQRLPHRADAITNYVANAVTRGYARHPGVEIPVPGPRFADRVTYILTTNPPGTRRLPKVPAPTLPSRPERVPDRGRRAGQ
ncbi:DUF6207 family protein [Streptomyces sp. NPDC002755]|uniref:hypothetical protein n=1 Tax=Streptomyces sp. NPDC002884 TaxID=3154544 RepID=UPI003326D65D